MYMCRWIIPTTFNIETANNHSTEAARLWCAFPSFAPWMPWMPWMCWMCWLMLLGCPASPGLTFASKSHGHQLYVPWTVAQVSDC